MSHDPMECIDFLFDKLQEGQLLNYISDKPACAFQRACCVGEFVGGKFCDEETPIGELALDGDRVSKLYQIDEALNGEPVAQGPMTNPLLKAIIARIVMAIVEKFLEKA